MLGAGPIRELQEIRGRIEVARHLTVRSTHACTQGLGDAEIADHLTHAADALALALVALEARSGGYASKR